MHSKCWGLEEGNHELHRHPTNLQMLSANCLHSALTNDLGSHKLPSGSCSTTYFFYDFKCVTQAKAYWLKWTGEVEKKYASN